MNTHASWSFVFRLGIGLAGLVLGESAVAQSSDATVPRFVTMTFVSFGDMPKGLQFQDGDKVVTAIIPSFAQSSPIRYSGGAPFVLFRQTINTAGSPVRATLATVSYPADWKKVLIAFFPGRRGGMINALAFDNSDTAFPADYVRLFNFNRTSIAFSSGGVIEQIEAGQSKLIPMTDRDPYGRVWLKLAILKDQWQQLPVWTMPAKPGMRALLFAYEKVAADGGMQNYYLTIPETSPPPKPKASTSPDSSMP